MCCKPTYDLALDACLDWQPFETVASVDRVVLKEGEFPWPSQRGKGAINEGT